MVKSRSMLPAASAAVLATLIAGYAAAIGSAAPVGLLAAAPALAAIAARPRAVAAAGGYALALGLLVWAFWGTGQHLLALAGVAAVMIAGMAAARGRVASERAGSRAAARLVANEARTAAVLRSVPDALVVTDRGGRMLEFNPAAERMFGRGRGQVLGRTLPELLLPPAWRDAYAAALAGSGPADLLGMPREIPVLRADGTELPAELVVTSAAAAGAPVLTWTVRDLSAQRAAEAERQAMEQRLRQTDRLESLGQLAGGIAHDFNNSLSVILSYGELLVSRTPNGPDRRDAGRIVEAAEKAARLTRQLLVFARRDPAAAGTVDVNAVVRDTHALLARTLGEHIELEVELSAAEPAVTADRSQVEQILLNLAVNARDAMADGGLLRIGTSVITLAAGDPTAPPLIRPGHYLRISVSDTGIGMPPEVAEHAFEPFFTTKAAGDGAGLGLATVYGIAAKAGGGAEIRSEPGRGTTVAVYLPLAGAEAPVPVASADGGAPAGGETILLVEDEEAVREVIGQILDQLGYRVLAAAGGHEALALAEQHPVDLLFTDVVMPHMSGRELVEQLRRRNPDLAVLFMSGYPDGLMVRRADEPDVQLVQKPFTAAALREQVRAALAGVRSRQRIG